METGGNLDHAIGFDFTKLPPSQWGDHFLTVTITASDLDALAKEIEVLKPKVRYMLILYSQDDVNERKRKIVLIKFLVSLGLSSHFENEIEEILKWSFEKIEDLIADENDLYTISILFNVVREYGYNMSSDVFKRFIGDNGKFKECLIEDVKGMMSLYEATKYAMATDYVLDQALSFTLNHLDLVTTCRRASSKNISIIQKAFYTPQHWNNEALVAREYISFCEDEKDCDKKLLNLAKLSLKFSRLHYFQELKVITKWWRELDHTLNLPPHFRERTVEAWFVALQMNFEPQFSLGRIMSAKLYLVITFLDDACEHGSIPEVASLVDCLERWDQDYMENLQGHMKTAFKFVLSTFKEYEEVLRSDQRIFVLQEMIEEFKILARANLELGKWAKGDEMPSFHEYIELGGAEVGSYATIASSIMALGKIGKKKDFKWLRSRPKLIYSLAAKTRLMDDMIDFEDDMSKGYTANALNYYMKEHGLTKEEANREFHKMIGDINKIVNEEWLNSTNISRPVLMLAIKYGRMLDVLYNSGDIYNDHEGNMKEYLTTLLVNPINI